MPATGIYLLLSLYFSLFFALDAPYLKLNPLSPNPQGTKTLKGQLLFHPLSSTFSNQCSWKDHTHLLPRVGKTYPFVPQPRSAKRQVSWPISVKCSLPPLNMPRV